MTKPKRKLTKKNATKTAAGRGARKSVDLEAIRGQIRDLVGNQAVDMVEITIAEVDKGHYAAMKYLFEMIGLYPASAVEIPQGDDSLAQTLLQRLGLPAEVESAPSVTKGHGEETVAGDAVE